MTVHAAKGLEFDCVAVADLGRSHTAGELDRQVGRHAAGRPEQEDEEVSGPRVGLRLARAGAGSLTVDGYTSITAAAAAAEAQETGRLIYVAASRARERLLLSGIYKEKELVSADDAGELPASATTIRRLIPGFGIADDGESAGLEIEIAAPEPRADLEATFEPATIRARFNRPTDEHAAGLALARRAPAPAPGSASAAPCTSCSRPAAAKAGGSPRRNRSPPP